MPKAFLMPDNSSLRTIFIPNDLLDAVRQKNDNFLQVQTVSAGANITLPTVDAQKLQVGKTFASIHEISDSCWAIRNTLFNPVSPKPDWYDGLKSKFNTVKRYADEWIDNIAIAVTATIPSSIINFVPTFSACANTISTITQRSPGVLSPNDLIAVREIISRLIGKIDEISINVNRYAQLDSQGKPTGKLVTWQQNISEASLDLKGGTDTIQKASMDLSKQIMDYNNNIEALKRDIAQYNMLIATGAGMVGGGAFVATVGGAVCLAFPVIGGIIVAISVLSIIGGSITWGYYQNRINKANAAISDYTTKITQNQQTLVALNSLTTSVDLVVQNAEMATKNLTDFAASWVTFGNSLRSTQQNIEQGGKEAYGILLDLDMETAKLNWEDVKAYATTLLESPSGVTLKPASAA